MKYILKSTLAVLSFFFLSLVGIVIYSVLKDTAIFPILTLICPLTVLILIVAVIWRLFDMVMGL